MRQRGSWFSRLRAALTLRPQGFSGGSDVRSGAAAGAATGWRRPQHVLLPVNPVFIWVTLFIALALNLLPWGHDSVAPDFLAIVLVFWNVHEPRRLGIGAAFAFGLLMDVHDAALLGQHALAYTLLSYGAIALHRRILWFPLGAQSFYIFPLLIISQIASLVVRLWVGGTFPGWGYFVESVIGAALWPVATWLLLAPQRRSMTKDDTRPL